MAQSLEQYIASVRSRFIDVDGWFGAQCWDQWSHYATNFIGVPALTTWADAGGSNPHSGYACNVHHNAHAAGLGRWFEILPASASPRAGDVAFWEYGSAWYPWSHVATVLDVVQGGRMLRCLTQNPGAVQIADLITNGIIGYLRPRALNVGNVDTAKTNTLTLTQKEQLMANANGYIATKSKGKQINAIFNTESGFFHKFESGNGEYNTNILRTFGVAAPSSMVSESHFNAVERDCANVRARRV